MKNRDSFVRRRPRCWLARMASSSAAAVAMFGWVTTTVTRLAPNDGHCRRFKAVSAWVVPKSPMFTTRFLDQCRSLDSVMVRIRVQQRDVEWHGPRRQLPWSVLASATTTNNVPWTTPIPSSSTLPSATLRPPANVRLLILPGFGNIASDYYDAPSLPVQVETAPVAAARDSDTHDRDATTASSSLSLVESLVAVGGWDAAHIRVLNVTRRRDWLQVFTQGARDAQFWQGTADPTRPAFRWYLDLVATAISELTAVEPDTYVVLLGHSAGGWLARAALGFGSDHDDHDDGDNPPIRVAPPARTANRPFRLAFDRVLGITTLGSPHLPPPPEIMDMTRGALLRTHERFPGAHHSPQDLFYVTVMGDTQQGVSFVRQVPWQRRPASGFAFDSYFAVSGNGTARGDGVVPLTHGHLTGARQIELAGVWHSMNVPSSWYGSPSVLPLWHGAMVQDMRAALRRRSSPARRTRGASPPVWTELAQWMNDVLGSGGKA